MYSVKYRQAHKSAKCGFLLILLIFLAGQVFAEAPASLDKILPQVRIVQRIDDADRVTLSGDRLPQLDSSVDQGPVDGNMMLNNMMLILKSSPEQQKALEAFSLAQQTPGAAEYHRWLTPEEFAAHFGVAAADLTNIKNYLTGQGFQIDEIAAGGRRITFSGTATQVKNSFHTEIHRYIWRGENHIANNSNPQIPAALANVVTGIVNIHDFRSHVRKQFPQTGNTSSLSLPLSSSAVQYDLFPIPEYNIGGANYLSPKDYGVIYDINPLYNSAINGSGVKIAILGRSDILNSDVASFQSFAGLASNPPQTIVTNSDPGLVSGDQTESTLDVEWAGGVAPGATVIFITSSSPQNGDGVIYSADYAVNNNTGDIISFSYGACEKSLGYSQTVAWGSLWQQAQTQGQTVLVSAGDSGAAGCDADTSTTATGGAGVNGLCSSPYSTCVGGTEFNDTSNPSTYWLANNPGSGTATALSYIPENVWNASGAVSGGSDLYASGGGKSKYWAKPSWQVSPGVPADGVRDVPDVALTAALHDGYIIYLNGGKAVVGGTSAAAPSLAGILALLEQYNGGRQGNINPTLYGLYQLQSSGGYNYFHPTVSGNNSVPGQTGFSATGTGYNLATGLGSVDANLLVKQWNNLTPVTSSTAINSPTTNLVAGQAVTFTATVSGFNPTGNIQFQDNGVALGSAVTLTGGAASLTTSALTSPGLNSVTAVYSGDGNNLGSTSAALNETVFAVTSVTVSVSPASISSGQSLTLTATVTGDAPTGTVQFYSNGAALGSPVTLINNKAVLTTTGLTVTGNDQITAVYSGDSLNEANTSATVTETVLAAQPQIVPALTVWQELLLACVLFSMLLWLQKTRI
jgi:subtilase family serine protease